MRRPGRVPFVVVLVVAAVPCSASPRTAGLSEVRSWAYQLTEIDSGEIARSEFDLVVVDYSRDGSEETAFSPEDVARMKQKPGDGRRIVISYLSIGEAEVYRYYWNSAWNEHPPRWLDEENPDWEGNYKVRYWDPDWRRVIFGQPDSYLDKIIAAGFDGAYLDIIDAFEYYEDSRPTAAREMIDFVRSLSAYAKEKAGRPFFIFPQNGERLLEVSDYLEAIDGLAKEDLYYGYEEDGVKSPDEETEYSLPFLRIGAAAGKLILTVDYVLEDASLIDAYNRALGNGFIPYATVRDLDRLLVHPGVEPAQVVAELERRPTPVRRSTPGLFFATTAPRGALRLRLLTDVYREEGSFPYETEEGEGFEVKEEFTEIADAVAISYGVTSHFELGVLVPMLYGHVERRSPVPLEDEPSEDSETGIGNVRILAAGGSSWNEGSDNLLVELEVGLPTDTRGESFKGEGDARLAMTGEHYWDYFGLIGVLATDYAGQDGFKGGDWSFTYQLGFGLDIQSKLFLSTLVGEEAGTGRLEVSGEIPLSSLVSLEMFAGQDLTGSADARFFGFGLNFFWIGE